MEQTTKTYEGMFLLEEGQSNMEVAGEPIRDVLGRSDAEILRITPWEERRLAYQILGRKRGLYVLVYFKMDPQKVTEMEHDCRLNEKSIRMLILRRDHLTDKELNAETTITIALAKRASEDTRAPEEKPEASSEPVAEERASEDTPAPEEKPEASSEPVAEEDTHSADDAPAEEIALADPPEAQENNDTQESPDR